MLHFFIICHNRLNQSESVIFCFCFMPAHYKTYKDCVTSKDSDQPVYPSSMARVLVYPSLDSAET